MVASSLAGLPAQANCPVCGTSVPLVDINQHLDSQCTLRKVLRSPNPPIGHSRSLPGDLTAVEKIDLTALDDREHHAGLMGIAHCTNSAWVAGDRPPSCRTTSSAGDTADEAVGRCESPACDSDVSMADSELAFPLHATSFNQLENDGMQLYRWRVAR